MGTPGDKTKIGKVVKSEQELEQEVQQQLPIEDVLDPTLPSTSSTGMCRISRLQEYQIVTPETFQTSLEQATIEDYFTQRKFLTETPLPSSTSAVLPSSKTFLNIDQPGPSGLQTPKTKPTTQTTLEKLKKTKKQHPKSHSCTICQKNFTTIEKLNKHQQIHTGTSPFKCENCKKTFTSKFKLVRHALIHSDRKPFSCTVCERTFHRKDHLKNHIKVHSPSKKVYICDKVNCKKEYTSVLSYRKHQAIHAAEEGNLVCQICSDQFQTKDDILYHLKVHAGSRTVKSPHEKKFVCDQCGRRFFTKKDVRRHLVVHTGLREFLCQFCPQRFGRKDHLVRHIKKSHNKKYQEDVQISIKTEPEASTSSTLPSTSQQKDDEDDIKQEIDLSGEFDTFSEGLELSFEGVKTILDDDEFPSNLDVLEDLGSTILDDIEPSMENLLTTASPEQQVILNDPIEIQRLLQPSEERNLKLPAFSKTFQPPPPT